MFFDFLIYQLPATKKDSKTVHLKRLALPIMTEL